ncbi:MAG TPA: efflux RND transporter periplasmic adaptor subunit [Blastocatellia bacterium]|nr:efflux RND transporter periplasmic adaptor subunit [Blastocatellia bacterium]
MTRFINKGSNSPAANRTTSIRRKYARNRIALVLLMTCLIATYACQNKSQLDAQRPPASVTVVSAVSQDVPVYLDAIGKTVAREVVSIEPQVSGRVISIHFSDGADVKKGDLLFTIDPQPFEVSLQQARANLARSTALKKQAEANLVKDTAQAKTGEVERRRYEQLVEQGVVSKQQFDQVRTNSEALNATVSADIASIRSAEEAMRVDETAIDSAKVQLAYCYIRSPIDGRAGQRLVDIGNVVNPGNIGKATSMLVIQRLDPIYADFTIPQSELSIVQRNMAQGTLRAEVRLPDESGNPIAGDLTFLDNAVQNTTGTVNLRATIQNNNRKFWPGRFVNVRLVLNTIRSAILIPASAPQMSAKGQFVYVVTDDLTAELRPVDTGQRQGEQVVINRGIKTGERVVVQGQIAVTPGGKVNIVPTPATETAENAGGGGL